MLRVTFVTRKVSFKIFRIDFHGGERMIDIYNVYPTQSLSIKHSSSAVLRIYMCK